MFRIGHIIWTHVSLRKIHQDNVSSISIIRLDITNVYFDTQIYVCKCIKAIFFLN